VERDTGQNSCDCCDNAAHFRYLSSATDRADPDGKGLSALRFDPELPESRTRARELHRVNVLGDMVAVELSIQGTFLGPLQTPSRTFEPTGAKVDGPCADFWYLRDGKIERFDCYIMFEPCAPKWA
jgi:hypothetical protein